MSSTTGPRTPDTSRPNPKQAARLSWRLTCAWLFYKDLRRLSGLLNGLKDFEFVRPRMIDCSDLAHVTTTRTTRLLHQYASGIG